MGKRVIKLTKKYYLLEDGTKIKHPTGFFDEVELPSIEEFQKFISATEAMCFEEVPKLSEEEIDDLIVSLSKKIYESIEQPFTGTENDLIEIGYLALIEHLKLKDEDNIRCFFDASLDSIRDTDGFVECFERYIEVRDSKYPSEANSILQVTYLTDSIEELLWSLTNIIKKDPENDAV